MSVRLPWSCHSEFSHLATQVAGADRSVNAVGEAFWFRPSLAFVVAPAAGCLPGSRTNSKLVIEPQTPVVGMKQRGVPWGRLCLTHQHYRRRPMARRTARSPDRDISAALRLACKPRGQEFSIAEFNHRRGVAGCEWCGLEDEFAMLGHGNRRHKRHEAQKDAGVPIIDPTARSSGPARTRD